MGKWRVNKHVIEAYPEQVYTALMLSYHSSVRHSFWLEDTYTNRLNPYNFAEFISQCTAEKELLLLMNESPDHVWECKLEWENGSTTCQLSFRQNESNLSTSDAVDKIKAECCKFIGIECKSQDWDHIDTTIVSNVIDYNNNPNNPFDSAVTLHEEILCGQSFNKIYTNQVQSFEYLTHTITIKLSINDSIFENTKQVVQIIDKLNNVDDCIKLLNKFVADITNTKFSNLCVM